MKAVIEETSRRIAPHVCRTECRSAPALSDKVGAEVHLKLENLQDSGSFKLRGVINKVLSLTEEDSQKLLVAASTGNHGAAFAHALQLFGLRGKLFMPKTSAAVKVENVRSTGVPFELVGEDCIEAEAHAAAFARSGGHVWISPYNDLDVVHGQGTVAVELMEQLEGVDTVLAPVGGGGLMSGIAAYLNAVDPSIEVIGCQPLNSCVMYESIKAGEILDIESLPTISDGTAGGIESGSITFDLCRRHVDDFILLEEAEIVAAMRFLHEMEGVTIEGAAALSSAAALKERRRFAGRRIALIVSGGRVDEATMDKVLKHEVMA
ncbi:MAG: threonine/serine dehydratase [Acidobacteria bacterium]|nr:threonine/serine dehydratase [Candidatus Sulfomarinibacter kjeldsenii]